MSLENEYAIEERAVPTASCNVCQCAGLKLCRLVQQERILNGSG